MLCWGYTQERTVSVQNGMRLNALLRRLMNGVGVGHSCEKKGWGRGLWGWDWARNEKLKWTVDEGGRCLAGGR